MKVDFLVIGAQKCGTSTLYRLLDRHPSIVGAQIKEPHFWTRCEDWKAELPAYHDLFPSQEGVLYFEASTTYTFYPLRKLEIWEDLYEYNPAMKFIYSVRNPIDRIISNYMHMYERGYTDAALEQELKKNRLYLEVSRYATQVKPFIRRFGEDQVLIVVFEDLLDQPEEFTREIAEFLGVDAEGFGDVTSIHANRSVGSARPHHKTIRPNLFLRGVRKFAPPLWRRFADNSQRSFQAKPSLSLPHQRMILHMLELEIDELERMAGRDLSHWRETREVP